MPEEPTTADDAVSPVIAVILMVAITVVLAAVTFVMISDLGETSEPTPHVNFAKQDTQSRLLVVNAPIGTDWNDVDISHSGCGVPLLNGVTALVSGSPVTSTETELSAGHYIQLAPGLTGCQVTLTYSPSNSMLGTWQFA